LALGNENVQLHEFFLVPGKGRIKINKVSGEKYLQYNTNYLTSIWAPLEVLNLKDTMDIFAIVKGGGLTGQADAIKLGVARQLCQIDQKKSINIKTIWLFNS